MDACMLMETHRAEWCEMPSVLVSGIDTLIKEVITKKWMGMACKYVKTPYIIVDMSQMGEFKHILQRYNLQISANVPGNRCISIFNGNAVETEDRLRQLMREGGWGADKINKGITYLEFLHYIDSMGEQNRMDSGTIDLHLLSKYSVPKEFEHYMEQLVQRNVVSYRDRANLLGRYSELSSVAPELENLITGVARTLSLTADKEVDLDKLHQRDLVYVHLGRVRDEFMRRILLQNLIGMIEDYTMQHGQKPMIIMWARGKSEDAVLGGFIEAVEEISQLYFCTDNFFSIENWHQLGQLFQIGIYSKHGSAFACENVEKLFGNIYVRKKAYAVAKDMSKSFWDKILGMNIVKTESITEPQEEAKYRKEDIACFPPGFGIIAYKGQNIMTQICG